MDKLFFDYKMTIRYSEVVNLCHFTFKCIPKDTARQKLVKVHTELDPSVHYSLCTDSFDNIKMIGKVNRPHLFLEYHISGELEINQILFEDEVKQEMLGLFKYPHGKNIAGSRIKDFYNEILESENYAEAKSDYEKAICIMQLLGKKYQYASGKTDVDTTAEEAFERGQGVCQDYAHIYIALLQLAGIPARYVSGMMLGEGKSHAWVEFCWRDRWIGIDPTNSLLVNENYIKLADGRDSSDCEINRGIMFGGGKQSQDVEVNVWKGNN